jgi:beta-galactosidase
MNYLFRNNKHLVLVMMIIIGMWMIIPISGEQYNLNNSKRETYNFNTHWLFCRGDESSAYIIDFADTTWANVNLPHTPVLEPFVTSNSFLGICWYRKHFTIDSSYIDKKIYIEFEAGMHVADVYVNGVLETSHKGGYLPFTVDITDNAEFGNKENIIAVRLDNSDAALSNILPPGGTNASRDFCFFGGLYRDSRIYFTDKIHVTDPILENKVASGGVFVTYTDVTTASATVNVKTHIRNEGLTAQDCEVITTLVDTNNEIIATTTTIQNISAGGDFQFSQVLNVSNPILWDLDNPYLYDLYENIKIDTNYIDDTKTKIGIRTIKFTKDGGFELNGERIKLMGANRHQDFAYLGNAGPNSLQYRDALLMKEAGMQYVRTSHYPQDPSFLDACDELGIVVMTCLQGWQYWADNDKFKNNAYQMMRDMIRRDRNHPSIIVWELSLNESDQSAAFSANATSILREEYPGDQAYSCGWNNWANYDVAIQASQHGARNYTGTYPFIISEYGDWDYGGSTSTSRCARKDGDTDLLTQVSNHQESLDKNRALTFLSADGLWSFEDYNRGYSSNICQSGLLDLMRLPKYSYYFYQSQRDPGHIIENVNSGPMVFIASSWQSGTNSVKVFSNCEEVDLYINDVYIKTQTPDVGVNNNNLLHPPFTFNDLTWETGKVEARAKIGGLVVAVHTVYTPGTPDHVDVEIENKNRLFIADGSDIVTAYAYIKSSNDTIVSNASNVIHFSVSGPAKLIGKKTINAEAGIYGIFIQAGTIPGIIQITASSEGLTSGSDEITSVAMNNEYPGVISDIGVAPEDYWTKIDDTHSSIIYSTQWTANSEDTGYKATNHYSDISDQLVKFPFHGTKVRYIGFKGNDLGMAEISIDDTVVAVVDCYNPTDEFDVLIYESELLSENSHNIMLRVLDTNNALSTGYGIVCDAFEYKALEIDDLPRPVREIPVKKICAEYWFNVPGSEVHNLTESTLFPDSPSGRINIKTLDLPNIDSNSYGVRIRGYLHPDMDKNYEFMISADNTAELWLSIDENPENKELIAYVPASTDKYQYDKYPQQKSVPVSLLYYKKYYFEVLYKEDTGDEHMTVAWENTGLIVEPIPKRYFSPYGDTVTFGDIPTMLNPLEYEQKGGIIIFPNPVYDYINIELTDDRLEGKASTIKVLDAKGTIILEQKIILIKHNKIDLNKLSDGIYFLSLELPEKAPISNVVIKKE